jgi:hypothetical protein
VVHNSQVPSCLPQILKAIGDKDVSALLNVQLDNPTRIVLDSISVTAENRDMLNIAKLVISLKEVEMLEREKCFPIINATMQKATLEAFQEAMLRMQILNFKPLITVPNKHSPLASNPIYQTAIADQKKLTDADLERIYQSAWSKIEFPTSELSLLILDSLEDWHFPNYAFNGICKGLISRYNNIPLISLPFGVDEDKLHSLCETLHGKQVTEIHLTLRPELPFNALTEFVSTIKEIQLKKLTLLGLEPQYAQEAQTIAADAGIELTLLDSPYQPVS